MSSKKKRYARRLDHNRAFIPSIQENKVLYTNKIQLDEFEAVRLVDYEGLSQIEASIAMEVSRATLQRLLLKGRKNIVEAILHNNKLEIDNDITNIKLKGENKMDIESREVKTIAFPSSDKVTIDKIFEQTKEFTIYSVKESEVLAVTHLHREVEDPELLPSFLANHDIDVIVCKKMSSKTIKLLDSCGIDVILGANGRIDVNLNDYIGGFLSHKDEVCIT